METSGSFIPKAPFKDANYPDYSSKKGLGFFLTFSVFVFLLSMLALAGTFVYKKILTNKISNMEDYLRKRSYLDISSIVKTIELSDRLDRIKTIVDNHVILSPLFSFLSQNTLKDVRFINFNFRFDKDKDVLNVLMKGVAKDYSALSSQIEKFQESPYTNQVLFSGVSLSQEGYVNFMLKLNMDKQIISYNKYVNLPNDQEDMQ